MASIPNNLEFGRVMAIKLKNTFMEERKSLVQCLLSVHGTHIVTLRAVARKNLAMGEVKICAPRGRP